MKAINSIDDNVRVSKRVFVPGRKLRGFESGKIGPKDGNQFIGGNYASALNLNSTLPNVLFENENIFTPSPIFDPKPFDVADRAYLTNE